MHQLVALWAMPSVNREASTASLMRDAAEILGDPGWSLAVMLVLYTVNTAEHRRRDAVSRVPFLPD